MMSYYDQYLDGQLYLEEAYRIVYNKIVDGDNTSEILGDKQNLEAEIVKIFMEENGYRYADEGNGIRILAEPEQTDCVEGDDELDYYLKQAKELGNMSSFEQMYFREAVTAGNRAIALVDNNQKNLVSEEIYWAIKRQINAMLVRTRLIHNQKLAVQMEDNLLKEWEWVLVNLGLNPLIIEAERDEIKAWK